MRRCRARLALGTLAAVLGMPLAGLAVQVGALESRWDWRLAALRVVGASAVPAREVRGAMLTTVRPWYAPWRPLPEFDPATFEGDIERVRALYRQRGYYEASIGYDLELPAEGPELTAVVYVDEGARVRVAAVAIDVVAAAVEPPPDPAELRALVALERGDPFVEARYRAAESRLRTWFRERGFARVTVRRQARVDLDRREAAVRYEVDPGPPCLFGDVTVAGNARVATAVIRRELAFAPGDPFRQSLLDRTRANLFALGLFSSVRLEESPGQDPRVDLQLTVLEGPPRSVRLGVGYDSEEELRALASWRHYDFLGGARQLGVTMRFSFLRQSLVADFLQPHFPTPRSRLRLLALQQREDEDPYTLDRTRGMVRVQWEPMPRFVTQVFYRAENESLSNVPAAVARAVPGAVPRNAVLSGAGIGLDWNATDDPLDPSRGFVVLSTVEPVGGALGGSIGFVRLLGELRGYVPLVSKTFAAVRVRAGTSDPWAGTPDVPIYERFFAGGTDSVRGYARWRVGPIVDDHPIGGRSLVEGAIELRRRLTDGLSAAVFLDAGQLSQESWRFPVDDLQLGTGAGIRYATPIGPIRVDIGFPLDRPRGDASWQVHFTVGPSF